MIDNSEVVWLEIRSFIGYGGVHYYGSLRGQSNSSDDYELRKTLTTREAIRLTRYDGHGYIYEKGDTTSRFDTTDEIEELALKEFLNEFPNCKLLINGNHIVVQPEPILWCIDPLDMEKLNKLWTIGDLLCNWDWDKNRKELNELCKQWEEIARKYTKKEYYK